MLTDAKIRKLKSNPDKKTPDKYSDSNGLQLHVFSTGRMTWIYAYRYENKQRSLTLGAYPDLSLGDARIKASDARKILNNGIDPNQAKKQHKYSIDENILFSTLAREWLESKKHVITEQSYLRDLRDLRAFEKDFFPYIGNMQITDIKGKDVLSCALKIEQRGANELAKRAIPLAGRVFRYAIRKGIIESDPTPHLQEALKPRKVQHMARLDISEFPEFLKLMDTYNGGILVKSAMLFINLTFVRTKELRYMEWSEVNFDTHEWRIPAHKMKMGLPHIVPLSKQALAILEELKPLTGSKEYVFYNHSTAKPLSENGITQAIENMGYKGRMTGHGFRGLASTTLHEQGYMHDAIELQLAHKAGNVVSQAYNHAQHLKYRANMMQDWANYIDSLRNKIIMFPKRAIG